MGDSRDFRNYLADFLGMMFMVVLTLIVLGSFVLLGISLFLEIGWWAVLVMAGIVLLISGGLFVEKNSSTYRRVGNVSIYYDRHGNEIRRVED